MSDLPLDRPAALHVFLIPTAGRAYELYYEPADDEPEEQPDDSSQTGMLARWRQRFHDMLREAERERHQVDGETPSGMLSRARRRMMRFVAERIAEWRLLWHLRRTDAAVAFIPSDLPVEDGERTVRAILKTDADRHFRWVVVNLLLLALSAPFMLLPGPNLFAYFVTFNLVGHFLAMRGARRGLNDVAWHMEPSAALSDLRAALTLTNPQRFATVRAVADKLRLQHLARFFERVAVPTA